VSEHCGCVRLTVNGMRFVVPLCRENSQAVHRLASGCDFKDAALGSAVNAVLGTGAYENITRGRRLDIFDKITLAVYICAKYMRAEAAAAEIIRYNHTECDK
jgi:hypothetical protein